MLPPDCHLPSTRKMVVWIQFLGYYDAAGKEVLAKTDQQTKLKFQMSEKMNYYSRRFDRNAHKPTSELFNINQTINYDLAVMYLLHRIKVISLQPQFFYMHTI